ncbi:MAG TPA: glycosyltransferase family A protein [Gemmatimonadaceae bacterium]|nr:glycosyltransferase family A protein [Gemmatimonadaceae bacterium]
MSNLLLSIIVPVSDAGSTLSRTLASIVASDLSRSAFEVIVVDDASTDGSAQIAARYADTVMRLSGSKCGAAYARNRGAEIARGNVIAFVDPDIVVHADTLPRMLRRLSTQSSIDAVTASHAQPDPADGWLSQYWKLLHRLGERAKGTSANVASPCAAIRRDVFLAMGMYDEWRFASASLEGIELGNRLEAQGHGAMLVRDADVQPLRAWNVIQMIREVWRRSALLARSLGYHRTRESVPSEVVFTLSRPAAPAFAAVCALALSAAIVPQPSVLVTLAFILIGAAIINGRATAYFARERGWGFALALAPLHLLMQCVSGLGLCAGWVLRDAIGDRKPDATTQAYAEVGHETWPPVPRSSGR